MKITPLFDLEKVLFLPYLPCKFGYEVKIIYVHLIDALNILCGGLNFSAPFQPLPSRK